MDSLQINKQMSNLKFVRAMFTFNGMELHDIGLKCGAGWPDRWSNSITRAIFVPWRVPSLLVRPLRSGPPRYLLRSSFSTNPRSCSAQRPCWVWIASRAHRPRWPLAARVAVVVWPSLYVVLAFCFGR